MSELDTGYMIGFISCMVTYISCMFVEWLRIGNRQYRLMDLLWLTTIVGLACGWATSAYRVNTTNAQEIERLESVVESRTHLMYYYSALSDKYRERIWELEDDTLNRRKP